MERATSRIIARLASGIASDNRLEWGTDDLHLPKAGLDQPHTAHQRPVRNKWDSRRLKNTLPIVAYIPVRLGKFEVNDFIHSGNTFANVIPPQMMTALGIKASQLEPIPQLSVGTAAAGKKMKILGQAPRLELKIGQHPTKFRIRPLVLQGLVRPLNLCGPFLQRVGIDQIHSSGLLRIHGKEVSMCSPRHAGG